MTDQEPEETAPEDTELEPQPGPAPGTEEWYRSECKYGLYGIYWAISTLAFDHDITPRKAASMLEYADNPVGEMPSNPWPSILERQEEEDGPPLRLPGLPPTAPAEGEPDFYKDLSRLLDWQRSALEMQVRALRKGWAQMKQLLKKIKDEGHQSSCGQYSLYSKKSDIACTCIVSQVEEVLLKIEKESHE